jgi:hypothetical protein
MFRFKNFSSLRIKELRSEKISNLRVLQITQPIWNIALLVNRRVVRSVIEQAIAKDENLISDQADTQEADVLIAIMKLMNHPGDKIHMKQIATLYNKLFGSASTVDLNENVMPRYDYKIDLSYRKIGEIVGKTLHVRKSKDNKGVHIIKNKATKLILKELCERYGVTDDLIN